ncbi:alpha-E domain-containing protein [Aestuariicella sp. G3-2]|uniref:alpha-E domain-containing protein n=1 Tax=Pseudomaricurvus albidus TaxID=2842452 RepID=UPI001C0BE330|nr:alpha-E domain-containing protein [Aestuariicella albida]MBU3068321.1 alpha-E domain-containing protein [Aestuariicella albida]
MMLSRVAERIYWTGRYLERVANTARLISIYETLLFDLPKTVELSWYNLIIINDLQETFGERYSVRSERNVVKFLLGDDDNSSSLINSLKAARENVRTTRDVVPEEAWEMICELTIYVQDNLEQGINRRSRHEFLEDVIKGCLQINGLLFSTMPHVASWEFFQIGYNLERADMTVRYLEAGLTGILELADDDYAVNSQQVIWGSVLRSLNATQYYLRTTRSPVKGHEVMPYLLNDPAFPKSIAYCIKSIVKSCHCLPRSEPLIEHMGKIEKKLNVKMDFVNPGDELLNFLNQLQILITSSHFVVSDIWFPSD